MFRVAKVVFPYPIEDDYTYIVPPSMFHEIITGKRVTVELKNRIEEGIVVGIEDQTFLKPGINYKEIMEVLDPFPIVNQEQILLAYDIAEEYLCEVGEALDKMYPVPHKLSKKELEEIDTPKETKINTENLVTLSEEQLQVLEEIRKSLFSGKPSLHLIHGITGSGKTEIYLYLIAEVLKNNKQVLFLVPEISITVQMIQRIKKVVGENVAILHSQLRGKERFKEYVKILKGKAGVVLGTRSAVFAPLDNLGLIIIDEEHDTSFRDNSHPRYDARLIARKRSEIHKIPLVLGSATPRIEIRYLTEKYNGQEFKNVFFQLHFLKKRVLGKLPEIQLIERDNFDQPVSNQLLHEIETTLRKGKQALILLNRRGFNPYLYCKNCNTTIQCPNCSISLNVHKENIGFYLKCHYCNHHAPVLSHCPKCGKKLYKMGTGIQKVEEYLLQIFPGVNIERLDTDVVHKENVLRDVIDRFIKGEIHILTGTQMIAKGIDAPNLNLVGVLQADSGFHLPDFRAAERTFFLLVQVAGRSGRRDTFGKVFFEVFDKNNPYLLWALRQDYDSFFKHELVIRKDFRYPPYSRLIRLLLRAPRIEKGKTYIQKLFSLIHEVQKNYIGMFEIIGPSEAPIFKLHNKYRFHLLIKTQYYKETIEHLKHPIKLFKNRLDSEYYLEIEIDPVDIL